MGLAVTSQGKTMTPRGPRQEANLEGKLMTSDTKKSKFFKMVLLVLKKKITKANQITKECMVCEGEK